MVFSHLLFDIIKRFSILFKSARNKAIVWVLLILTLGVTKGTIGQAPYPNDYFQPPVSIRMLLSGTFGELRTNHFHSGIDIKTNGSSGQKIYAIGDGYISRINVSAFGFGKAIYVDHPNGYTSVYAHLDYFTGDIHDFVIKEHYERESFEMTIYLKPGELPVKKGDVIAYSGNSGSSAGPHLHFEIRETATQHPVNPLLFGFDVKDFYKPRITWLKVYAVDGNSRINGKSKNAKAQVEGWGQEHRLSATNPISASGNIAFGIQCYDLQNDAPNKNGVYAVKVYFDGRIISSTQMESFAFSETRYINSFIDYQEFMEGKMRFQRTEVDPGNRLSVYQSDEKGVVFIDDEQLHHVKFEVADVAGNTSILEFDIQGQRAIEVQPGLDKGLPSERGVFYYNGNNAYKTDDFILEAPAGAFYRSFEFKYHKSKAPEDCFSELHHVHDKFIPIQENISIGIKPQGLPERLRDKALIVRIQDEDQSLVSAGGKYEKDGFVYTRTRDFGDYSVSIDTVPPEITPMNAKDHKSLAGKTVVKFKIKDDLSGIKSYRGTLNGQWILMDYDAKNDLLVYFIEGHMNQGENAFRLEVADMKDNKRVYEAVMVK